MLAQHAHGLSDSLGTLAFQVRLAGWVIPSQTIAIKLTL